jgi:phospholipid-translocating ATPase
MHRLYMVDGVYQSIMCFFIPYLAFTNGSGFVTSNGLDVTDRYRLGAYIAHPTVITINLYVLINTYRWDWLMLLVVVLSDLFVLFWTGVWTANTYSSTFYQAAPQVYAEASFWAVFFVTPVVAILPRYAIKAIQKVYFPYDVDIIREQMTMGLFDHLKVESAEDEATKTGSSRSSAKSNSKRHQQMPSVDEDRRPIYPPTLYSTTTTHNAHSQNGSDGTNYTRHEPSTEITVRPSLERERVRPSYDRMRASMDRVRPSYEQSNEFTSAAMLSRLESTRSGHPDSIEGNGLVSRIRRRTRGKSFKSAFAFHKDNHIHEHD